MIHRFAVLRSWCSLFVIWAAALAPTFAQAVDILDTAENILFEPKDSTRIGIEVEFKGVTVEQSAKLVAESLGGTVTPKKENYTTTLKETLADGTKVYNKVEVTEYIVKGSSIGDVVLKPDFNQVSDTQKLDAKNIVIELVTEPIRYPQVEKLQNAMDSLLQAGATGTTPNTAVAIQVNMEFARGNREQMKVDELLDLMRAYLRPEHREQIRSHLKIPKIRQQYLEGYSKGFTQRLLDPAYKPSWRELFDDFVYRQSLEFLGEDRAWTMSVQEAQKLLLAQKNPIVPRVVKLNPLRVSSLLMFVEPSDPMTKLYHSSGWAVPRPLVEFREWNTDFNVRGPTRQALGLAEGVRKFGYFDHDKLVYSLTGVDEKTLATLRKKTYGSKTNNPLVFRYFLGDAHSVPTDEYANLIKAYSGTVVGFIPADTQGRAPVVVPGESVVFHRRPFHRYSVMGKYNPGLINFNIAQALENKYAEARFFNEFSPGSMPETVSLRDLAPIGADVRNIVSGIQKRFPQGWVLKGVWDLGSEREILTDKYDLVKEVEAYRSSDFDKFKSKTEAQYAHYKTAAPEYIQTELKAHPNYKGWKISQILGNPDLSIVQNRVDIVREFRVEVIGGRVLGGNSTVDRWYYTFKQSGRMKEYVPPSKDTIREIESWTQAVVDRIPAHLRGMPMGMDVALLKDGGFTLIESNPGGNSSFLFEEEPESIRVLQKYLEEFPELVRSGRSHLGLSAEEQMAFLNGKFKQWGIDLKKHYPGMNFLNDRIDDFDYQPREVRARYYSLGAPRGTGAGTGCLSSALTRIASPLFGWVAPLHSSSGRRIASDSETSPEYSVDFDSDTLNNLEAQIAECNGLGSSAEIKGCYDLALNVHAQMAKSHWDLFLQNVHPIARRSISHYCSFEEGIEYSRLYDIAECVMGAVNTMIQDLNHWSSSTNLNADNFSRALDQYGNDWTFLVYQEACAAKKRPGYSCYSKSLKKLNDEIQGVAHLELGQYRVEIAINSVLMHACRVETGLKACRSGDWAKIIFPLSPGKIVAKAVPYQPGRDLVQSSRGSTSQPISTVVSSGGFQPAGQQVNGISKSRGSSSQLSRAQPGIPLEITHYDDLNGTELYTCPAFLSSYSSLNLGSGLKCDLAPAGKGREDRLRLADELTTQMQKNLGSYSVKRQARTLFVLSQLTESHSNSDLKKWVGTSSLTSCLSPQDSQALRSELGLLAQQLSEQVKSKKSWVDGLRKASLRERELSHGAAVAHDLWSRAGCESNSTAIGFFLSVDLHDDYLGTKRLRRFTDSDQAYQKRLQFFSSEYPSLVGQVPQQPINGKTDCSVLIEMKRNMKSRLGDLRSTFPLLMEVADISQKVDSKSCDFVGCDRAKTLSDRLNQSDIEYESAEREIDQAAQRVRTNAENHLAELCGQGSNALVAEGSRVSCMDGLAGDYFGCKDMPSSNECRDRRSCGWTACRACAQKENDRQLKEIQDGYKSMGLFAVNTAAMIFPAGGVVGRLINAGLISGGIGYEYENKVQSEIADQVAFVDLQSHSIRWEAYRGALAARERASDHFWAWQAMNLVFLGMEANAIRNTLQDFHQGRTAERLALLSRNPETFEAYQKAMTSKGWSPREVYQSLLKRAQGQGGKWSGLADDYLEGLKEVLSETYGPAVKKLIDPEEIFALSNFEAKLRGRPTPALLQNGEARKAALEALSGCVKN